MPQQDIDAAYAAGLFDGEGYVDIYHYTPTKRSRNLSFVLRIIVTQKDGLIMKWLKDAYSGSVKKERNGKFYIYRWSCHSGIAKKFLETILPHVKIKKPQVELALEFISRKKNHGWIDKKTGKFARLSSEEIEIRHEMQKRLKKMKKEYVIYQE